MQQQPYEVARVRAYESAGLSRTRLVIAVDKWELARLRDYEVTRLRGYEVRWLRIHGVARWRHTRRWASWRHDIRTVAARALAEV